MWFLRHSKKNSQPEALHISRSLDQKWFATQIQAELVKHGLTHGDISPEAKRADMEFLHRLRTRWERGVETVITVFIRTITMTILAIFGWAAIYYIKELPL